MALALDIDAIRYAIGDWQVQMPESGRAARRIAAAMAREHLGWGHDVFVSQYLGDPRFIVELETVASAVGAEWVEIVLLVDVVALARRLQARKDSPDRAEHAINNELAGPDQAATFVDSMAALTEKRARAARVDASGEACETLCRVENVLLVGGGRAHSH